MLRAFPPEHDDDCGARLVLNATRESAIFAPVTVPVFAPAGGRGEAELPGVYFLHRAHDADSGDLVLAESGGWLNVPRSVRPPAPAAILRLTKRAEDVEVLAQGVSCSAEGAVPVGSVSGLPVDLVSRRPVADIRYLDPYATVVLPAGIRHAVLLDPLVFLRDARDGRRVGGTVRLRVSTDTPSGAVVADVGNTAFEVENPPGLTVEVTVWLETLLDVRGAVSAFRLQFCSRWLRGARGVAWPEVWVATFERAVGRG